MNTFLWAVFPYVALTLFFVVPFVRMVYRPYGLTTRASGLFGRNLLALASLLFHWGIILLFVGHLVGLVGGVLGSGAWVNGFYWIGLVGGLMAICGSVLALLRRHFVPEVRAMSKLDDYLVHYLLIGIIGIGLYQSLVHRIWGVAFAGSAWFASLWRFQPEPELMAGAGLLTQIHVFLGLVLAAYFPFTKLIHVWTYPINFFVRPYQSMRTAANKFRRRWELGLRTDKSFLTYTVLTILLLLVGVGFLLRQPTLAGFEVAAATSHDARAGQTGYALFVSQCARCHGVNGDGNGLGRDSPTFLTVPRDLTKGEYRFVSTTNAVASDDDLRHVINNGLPTSGMPGFATLSRPQVDSLVAYLNHIWVKRPQAGPRVAITAVPTFTAAMADRGRKLYADNCAVCHGDKGLGDGPAAAGIEDFPGHRLPPANLAAGQVAAGADPVQLYYRIAAGIPAGANLLMPAFDFLKPDEVWDLVAHLRRDVLPPTLAAAATTSPVSTASAAR